MLETLKKLFDSQILVRLVVLVLTYFYYQYTKKKKVLDSLTFLPSLIGYYILRDIAYHIFQYTEILMITDVGVVLFLYKHLSYYTQKKYISFRMIFFNLLICAFYIANTQLDIFYMISLWIGHIWVMINYGILAGHYYQVSEFNISDATFIVSSRRRMFTIIYVYLMSLMVFGYHTGISHSIFMPIGYSVFLYMIFRYDEIFEEDQEREIESLEANFNSIFGFMKQIGDAMTEKLEIDKVLEYVVESAVKDTGADGGAIFLIDEFEDALVLKSTYGKFPPPYPVSGMAKIKYSYLQEYMKSTPVPLGTTILGEAAQTGIPIYIRNSREDHRMTQNTKNDIMFISSIIVVPLIVSDKVLGIVSIISKDSQKLFNDEHFEHIKTFANYTSLSINNIFIYMELLEKQEMEREVGIAAEIQQQLLPRKLPKTEKIALSAFSVPAKGVSGDYYDILPIRKNKIALVMCDVAGKGVPASLVMVMIRTIIHLIAGSDRDTSTIMGWVNRGIAGKIALDRFATMSFLTYNTETKEVQYSNAAHHPLLVYKHATGQMINLDTEGIPIGLEKTTQYGQIQTKVEKGDILVLYTDGIIEAMNPKGDQYTYERLEAVIRKHSAKDIDNLTKIIKSDLDSFVGNAKQHDDQTMLLLKVK